MGQLDEFLSQVLAAEVLADIDRYYADQRESDDGVASQLVRQLAAPRPADRAVTRQLGLPVFVKPANLGSSVGISKVINSSALARAVKEAFRYDNKILIEEYIQGREIECSILGNENPIASLPGEIVTRHHFYSYEAKYLDNKGAELMIPAKLPVPVARTIQEIAIETFKVLCCEGMARVDFFLRGRNEVLVNEINTIPGFTQISMYPKLWEASGIPYAKLIDRLIQLALDRFRKEKALLTSI
jgi:D-alanine-D-alanine ligase